MSVDEVIRSINSDIAGISDDVIDLQLGILFNHMVERMDTSGDLGTRLGYLDKGPVKKLPRSTQSVAFLSLYLYVKRQVTAMNSETFGKDRQVFNLVVHPFTQGGSGAEHMHKFLGSWPTGSRPYRRPLPKLFDIISKANTQAKK